MAKKPEITPLVQAAQAGDDESFSDLVHAYQDIAVAYATALLGDYHLAEDVAQEAFVEAHRALPSLREPAAFAAWFRRIIFKHCDRQTRRKRPPTTGLDAAVHVASPAPSPHDVVESHETRLALRTALSAAIATLSGAEQQVVLLYYMGDRSHAAIADFLGVTANTVKTRLYSARQRLRRHMDEIAKNLDAARPSGDPKFAERIARMIRPPELDRREPLVWSPGIGSDVWELFCASIAGDLETVKRLVAADPSLVRAHHEYRTPLSFAVKENQVEVAAFLLAHGADALALGDVLKIARERGYTEMVQLLEREFARLYGASPKGEVVAAAIRDRDRAAVRRLLDDAPELLHEGDARSSQPIHWATMTRQIDIIDDLLARGADIDAKRQDGALPIHLTNGDYHYRGWRDVPVHVITTPAEVYQHLVARGANVDIGMAAATGDLNRVRELLDRDPSLVNRVADYNSYYVGCGAAIKNAAVGGHLEIVKLLLERGADPNLPEEGIAPHGHALYSAVYNGHHEIAKLLLEHGAYPNPEVESSADAVHIAIMHGDKRMVELLAAYGATWEIPVGKRGGLSYQEVASTALGRSMTVLGAYGDVAAAEARLAEDPSLADAPEALENAASHGHEGFVRMLLHYAPDLARRVTVSKPRHLAELLFAHSMDPNRPNWLRQLPLHHFAQNGDAESATLFLDHGADINARDEEHRTTPLGYAARAGKTRMVELLLRRGARLTLDDDPPWAVPLMMAKHLGHDDVVRLLVEYEKTGALPVRRLDEFDALAKDLVEAFRSGADQALRRIMDFFQVERPRDWDRVPLEQRVRGLRQMVCERLKSAPEMDLDHETLALDDARFLIARAAGCESWSQLATQLTP